MSSLNEHMHGLNVDRALKNKKISLIKISKMKNHKIDIEGLEYWLLENEALFATDGRKKLVVTMAGVFRIYINKAVIWQGIESFDAVEKYNNF